MKWRVKDWLCESYKAEKDNGLRAYVCKSALWAGLYHGQEAPGYDVRYKGRIIASIHFEKKGATVKALNAACFFPEISDLDLVEIALWVNKLRLAGAHQN